MTICTLIISLLIVSVTIANAQTIDDVIQYIFDHQDACGDPFSDPVWVPALDLCTKGCDILSEICLEDAELNQKCDDLPEECAAGLKSQYGEGTKPLDPIDELEYPDLPEYPDTLPETKNKLPTLPEDHDHEHGDEDHDHGDEDHDHGDEYDDDDDHDYEAEDNNDHVREEETFNESDSGGYGGGPAAGGKDYHTWCCKWAFEGECDRRPALIRPLCQKSCGTEGCRAENAESCSVSVNVDSSTCWQLKGRDGNIDKDDSHFRPQPSSVTYNIKPGSSSGGEQGWPLSQNEDISGDSYRRLRISRHKKYL